MMSPCPEKVHFRPHLWAGKHYTEKLANWRYGNQLLCFNKNKLQISRMVLQNAAHIFPVFSGICRGHKENNAVISKRIGREMK